MAWQDQSGVRATSLGCEPQARGCKRDTLRKQDYALPSPEATNRDCKYGRPFCPASDLGHSPHLVAVTWIYESLSNLQVVASSVQSGTKPNPAAKIQPPNSVTICAWPPTLVDKVLSSTTDQHRACCWFTCQMATINVSPHQQIRHN